MDSTDTIEINGSLPNGQVGTTSPDSMAEPGSSAAMRKAKTISFFPVINVDSTGTVENGHPSSSCTSGSVEGEGLGHDSFSPPEFMVGSMMTPSRKSMEALKKVCMYAHACGIILYLTFTTYVHMYTYTHIHTHLLEVQRLTASC